MEYASLIIDNTMALLFTGNLDEFSMKKNLEIGIQLNNIQTNDLIKIHEHWKNNLSYSFVNQISIKDIQQKIIISNTEIYPKNIKFSEQIEKTNQPKTISDLIIFFGSMNFKSSNETKFNLLTLNAKIQKTLKTNLKFNAENYIIFEQEKMIVINDKFTETEISKIAKYKDYKLFYFV